MSVLRINLLIWLWRGFKHEKSLKCVFIRDCISFRDDFVQSGGWRGPEEGWGVGGRVRRGGGGL